MLASFPLQMPKGWAELIKMLILCLCLHSKLCSWADNTNGVGGEAGRRSEFPGTSALGVCVCTCAAGTHVETRVAEQRVGFMNGRRFQEEGKRQMQAEGLRSSW